MNQGDIVQTKPYGVLIGKIKWIFRDFYSGEQRAIIISPSGVMWKIPLANLVEYKGERK